MIKPELNVNDYLRILKKRRYIVLLTVLAVLGFTYVFSLLKPVIYRTQVSLAFNYNKTITNMVNELAFNMATNLSTMAELITRTSVLEAAAVRMGVLRPGDPVEKRDAVVNRIGGKITTAINAASETLIIIVRSADPVEAADIANNVAEAFRLDVARRNSEEIRKARLFIETQRDDATNKLKAVEDELERFRQENAIVDIPIEFQNRLTIVNKFKETRVQLVADRTTLERRLAANAAAKGVNRTALEKILSTKNIDTMRQNLLEEEVRMVALQGKFQSNHPELVGARRRIDDLRMRLANVLATDFDSELVKLQVEIETLKSREDAYQKVIHELEVSMRAFPQIRARLERLEQGAGIYRDLIRSFNKKLEEIGVVEAEKTSQSPDIINRAPIPELPATGGVTMLLGLGLAGGAVLGFFLAFFIETIDVSVSTIEEVEEYLKLPVLGMLPFVSLKDAELLAASGGRGDISHRCITYYKPRSNLAEAFRIVRTNLRFKGVGGKGKTLLVTSSLSGEGKTFVAVNLGIIYAQLGARVLVIDCNLRDPEVHNYFSIPKNPGITDILIGDYKIDQAVRESGIKNLHVLTSGPIPPNPSELLEAPEFRAMLAGLEPEYDLIIADSPPLLPVADSTILTTVFARTIVVHNAIRTSITILNRSKATVESTGAKIDGIILNQLKSTLFMDANVQINYYYHKKEEPAE